MTAVQQATLTIRNQLGLHARAATVFVQVAARFAADITVSKDGREVNGKSIMGLLTLVASRNTEIHVRASGPDAEQALAALADLVEKRFGEVR